MKKNKYLYSISSRDRPHVLSRDEISCVTRSNARNIFVSMATKLNHTQKTTGQSISKQVGIYETNANWKQRPTQRVAITQTNAASDRYDARPLAV